MLQYDVFYHDKAVGQAKLERQGMFYRIHCQCNLDDDTAFRLHMITEHTNKDLGICTQTGKGIGMIARIPVSEIKETGIRFVVVPEEHEHETEVSECGPFQDLDKLSTAKFVRKDGKSFIIF